MDYSSLGVVGGAFVGWAAAALGWVKFFIERRDKRTEREAKARAEAALALIENRSDAPFFYPSSVGRNSYPTHDHQLWSSRQENILSPAKDSVPADMPPGTLVVLPIGNDGAEPRWITFKLEGRVIDHVQYADGNAGLCGLLHYPFEPTSHGKIQHLEVIFESGLGVQRCHTYEIKHGHKSLVRVDPPLPKF